MSRYASFLREKVFIFDSFSCNYNSCSWLSLFCKSFAFAIFVFSQAEAAAAGFSRRHLSLLLQPWQGYLVSLVFAMIDCCTARPAATTLNVRTSSLTFKQIGWGWQRSSWLLSLVHLGGKLRPVRRLQGPAGNQPGIEPLKCGETSNCFTSSRRKVFVSRGPSSDWQGSFGDFQSPAAVCKKIAVTALSLCLRIRNLTSAKPEGLAAADWKSRFGTAKI